ncbi:Uncharacterized protein family Cys-rich [Macleaya cordata]|uniref:Uncharacterized protein family Cys-rich n=1 Tax=Macleaya cordata TaxID=56857 RepID=A0A200QP47_MACCD|nr:Uncharacterized protein family Cys-rich [Macleaya cordata]
MYSSYSNTKDEYKYLSTPPHVSPHNHALFMMNATTTTTDHHHDHDYDHQQQPTTTRIRAVSSKFPPAFSEKSSPITNSLQIQAAAKPLPQAPLPPEPLSSWSTGLCDCLDDVNNCCITCWCPCITFGQVSEIVDKGSSSCGMNGALYTLIACVTGCPCFYSCFYRSKLRQNYHLKMTPCCDCLTHCCCGQCALCQEYRELKKRGFDMSIGWHGNLEKGSGGIVIAPIVPEGMDRSIN